MIRARAERDFIGLPMRKPGLLRPQWREDCMHSQALLALSLPKQARQHRRDYETLLSEYPQAATDLAKKGEGTIGVWSKGLAVIALFEN